MGRIIREVLKIKLEKHTCPICGEEHGLDDIHEFEVNGETKKICKGCATAVKGIA